MITYNDGWGNADEESNDGNISIDIGTVHISLHMKKQQELYNARKKGLKLKICEGLRGGEKEELCEILLERKVKTLECQGKSPWLSWNRYSCK